MVDSSFLKEQSLQIYSCYYHVYDPLKKLRIGEASRLGLFLVCHPFLAVCGPIVPAFEHLGHECAQKWNFLNHIGLWQ
jgi:hypothetical protein